MINLLPPSVKEEIAFSRRNAVALRYLGLILVVVLAAGGIFGAAEYYLIGRQKQVDADLATRNAKIETFKKTETDAKSLNTKIATIKSLLDNQTKFSLLIQDLASHTPSGVSINGIALTGDDKRPVQLNATLSKVSDAARLREALVLSARIGAADIVSVTEDKDGAKAVVVIGFKPGQAR